MFDVARIGAHDKLNLVAETLKHPEFHIRLETGKDAGGVQILQEFAPDFQIEFVAEPLGPFENGGGLERNI